MRLREFALVTAACLCFSCASSNTEPPLTWELLVPPLQKGPVYAFDTHARLSKWEPGTENAYRTIEECQADQQGMIENWAAQSRGENTGPGGSFEIKFNRLKAGRCITTNDPRLTSN